MVNGAPDVAPALAQRVHEAIRMLGYRRDMTASMLRRADRASATVGLLLEDVANPFFSSLHRSVEDVARTRGVLVFAGSSDEDPQRERELVESLVARGVDGLIIAPTTGDQGYLLRDREAGIAMVFVDRPPRYVDADSVVSDNAGGARRAVEHLIAGGHRRIAFLGDRSQVYTAAERERGYREAMAAHGLETLVHAPAHGPENARAATHELIADAPGADRAVHRPEPRDDRRRARAARPRPPARRRARRLRRRHAGRRARAAGERDRPGPRGARPARRRAAVRPPRRRGPARRATSSSRRR